MSVLAEFLFDFLFKNFSLFWLLFWKPLEELSDPALGTNYLLTLWVTVK